MPLKVEEEGVVEWVEADHGDRLRMFLEECDAPQVTPLRHIVPFSRMTTRSILPRPVTGHP